MKIKPAIISTICLFMFYAIGYSQTNDFSKSDRYYLVGTWLLDHRNGNESIVFKRKIGNQKDNSGFQIEISNNGIINLKPRKLIRKCGNNHRKPISKGSWSLDKENRVFKTTIPIMMNSQTFKIVELNINKMVLSVIKSE